MNRFAGRLCITLAVILAMASGCNDDPAAPEVGTFTINPEPNSVNAPWQISGPGGYAQSGTGDMTLANMTAGSYTVTWGAVVGWDSPSPTAVTQPLAANGMLIFTGTYVAHNGTVSIDSEPFFIDAPWHLTGPGGFDQSGVGDTTLTNMAAGDYTLTWGAVVDRVTPNPADVTQLLAVNGVLTFTGTYVYQTGTVIVNVEPDAVNATWLLSGPNSFSQSGAGDATMADMIVGNYTLTWGAVTGRATPSPSIVTQTLVAAETLTFAGTYDRQFPSSPNFLMDNFEAAYQGMDLDGLQELLHPNFEMVLQASTTAEFPTLGSTLDLAEETRIHQRMFAGQPVTDPDGVLVTGIASIEFQMFERQNAWTRSPPDDSIPDSEWALYDVAILFDRGAAYSIMKVQGQVKFYVAHRDSVVNGVATPYYRMCGQVDLTIDEKSTGTGDKATATFTWGTVKALYR